VSDTSQLNGDQDQLGPFVDAHHHLWDLERFDYDWLAGDGWPAKTAALGDYADIRRSYTVEHLLADFSANGVAKSVHLQADMTGEDPVTETRWLQEAADATGFPQAIVAYADPADSDFGHVLDRHQQSANMRGVRIVPDAAQLQDSAFCAGLKELGRRGLVFDLAVFCDDMALAADVVRRCPDTLFLLEHTGLPQDRSLEYFRRWRRGMQRLALEENVQAKISGLGTVDHHWTVSSLEPWISETIELFGPARCMFGTNWPVDRLYSSYANLLEAYRQIIGGLPLDDQQAVWRRTAERAYRI
jgi:predicted TIM-barrel fold metal-dependent hydrolase